MARPKKTKSQKDPPRSITNDTVKDRAPNQPTKSKSSVVIGGFLVFLFVAGAIADITGAWQAIRQPFIRDNDITDNIPSAPPNTKIV